MPHITLDETAIARLATVTGPVEIHDVNGKVIGFYRPILDPANYGSPISEEELIRRMNEPGPRYTTEEVIEMAKRRAQQEGSR